MPRIEEIDPKGAIQNGLHFVDPRQTPARFYGLVEGEYRRLPVCLHHRLNERMQCSVGNTSGGRIRFRTDSKRLGIRMGVTDSGGFPHMAFSGYAGLDIFSGAGQKMRYLGTRQPGPGQDTLETEITLPGGNELITIYLPLYDGIQSLSLGLEPCAALEAPELYSLETPIVFYGSSITQGGCANRTSNSYCALLSRWFDSDFINLGFSGSALGEAWMADYIAGLSMSCFVFDYDHNAPDPDYLQKTHLPFLQVVLEKQPKLPVILLSKPNPDLSGPDRERREIVRDTYKWAVFHGYTAAWVDGDSLLGDFGRDCATVDGTHPNDLGFWRMAEALVPAMQSFLGKPVGISRR